MATTPHSGKKNPQQNRIAPIFPVRDVTASLEHYRSLGFMTRAYDQGYGFAVLQGAEIHLGVLPAVQVTTPSSAYPFVPDADALFATWRATGADVRPPKDTAWGKDEGVVIDPDGNIIRFGSAVEGAEG